MYLAFILSLNAAVIILPIIICMTTRGFALKAQGKDWGYKNPGKDDIHI